MDKLHEFFTLRFVDTCNIDVAHLAYVLTADWLNEFRSLREDEEKYYSDLSLMKSVLATIAARVYTKEEISALCITGLFDYYVNYTEFDSGDNLYSFWNQIALTEVKEPGLNKGKKTSMKPFAEIALIIVTMPCAEAVCERFFSQMRLLLNEHNGRLSTEMFLAETIVKLSQKFKRKYE